MKFYVTMILALSLFATPALAQKGRGKSASTSSSPMSLFAERGIHELKLGMTQGSFSSVKAGSDTLTVIEATGVYARLIKPQIQIGGGVGFFSTSGGAKSQSYFEAFGSWIYNMDTDLSNSVYFRGDAGLFAIINKKGDYESKFGFGGGVGKRFALLGPVTYNPEARILKKGDQDPSIEIMFLNFSMLF